MQGNNTNITIVSDKVKAIYLEVGLVGQKTVRE
jgi:hypothetical protein